MDGRLSPFKEKIGSSAFSQKDNLRLFNFLKYENLVDNRIYNNEDKLQDYQDFKNVLELLSKVIKQEIHRD
jgi:hypothetical protein